MSEEAAVRDAVEKMWQAEDLDPLYESLAIRAEAADKGVALDQLEDYNVRDRELPKIEQEGSIISTELVKEIGRRWWEKFEPKIYDLLCNKENPEHDKFVNALGGSAKELAILLAPSLLASLAGAVPAVVVVVATIAAKRIAESGLEAMCEVWAAARAEAAEEGKE
jgi:hypothetical protein